MPVIKKRSKPSEKHNTYLSPDKEIDFQQWAGKRVGDTEDYDLRGYYNAVQGRIPVGNAHLTDEYKKPNHPTFSNESQYNGADGVFGGQWIPTPVQDRVIYEPAITNTDPRLEKYFQDNEPGNFVVRKRSK